MLFILFTGDVEHSFFNLVFVLSIYINDNHKQPSMFSTITWNLKPKIFPKQLMSTLIVKFSLRIQRFLLAPRRHGRVARRNVCDSVTEIPYWWRKSILTLLNKPASHRVPNVNLFDFMFLLVDYGLVLWSFANELQQNSDAFSKEEYIVGILSVFEVDSSRLNLTFVAFCVLFVNNMLGKTI